MLISKPVAPGVSFPRRVLQHPQRLLTWIAVVSGREESTLGSVGGSEGSLEGDFQRKAAVH